MISTVIIHRWVYNRNWTWMWKHFKIHSNQFELSYTGQGWTGNIHTGFDCLFVRFLISIHYVSHEHIYNICIMEYIFTGKKPIQIRKILHDLVSIKFIMLLMDLHSCHEASMEVIQIETHSQTTKCSVCCKSGLQMFLLLVWSDFPWPA